MVINGFTRMSNPFQALGQGPSALQHVTALSPPVLKFPVSYWLKQVTLPRGTEIESCHDRRNGKVAFQRDVYMVIRGITVLIFEDSRSTTEVGVWVGIATHLKV